MVIVWRKKALNEFDSIYQHIKKNSLQSAIKVRNEIFTIVDELELHPEILVKAEDLIKNHAILQ